MQTSNTDTSNSMSISTESPKSIQCIPDDMKIKMCVIHVFKDLLDGMCSVIEEYEDDPEWSFMNESEKRNIIEENLDSEEKSELLSCSTCGRKKIADQFGYKNDGTPYKSCIECRDKKKRKYEETKTSSDDCMKSQEMKLN